MQIKMHLRICYDCQNMRSRGRWLDQGASAEEGMTKERIGGHIINITLVIMTDYDARLPALSVSVLCREKRVSPILFDDKRLNVPRSGSSTRRELDLRTFQTTINMEPNFQKRQQDDNKTHSNATSVATMFVSCSQVWAHLHELKKRPALWLDPPSLSTPSSRPRQTVQCPRRHIATRP